MRARLFYFLLSVFFAQTGYSQDWIYVGKSKAGDTYYLRNSVVSETGYKKVWSKQTAKVMTYTKNGKKYKLINGYCVDLKEYDCDGRQIKLISWAYYNSSGNVVYSVKLEDYLAEWRDVYPDSVGEMLLEKVCELF